MAGGATFTSSVFPFILRNVALLGIDSVQTPMERRRQVWERMAGDLRPVSFLEQATDREVSLEEVGGVLDETLAGEARGARWCAWPEAERAAGLTPSTSPRSRARSHLRTGISEVLAERSDVVAADAISVGEVLCCVAATVASIAIKPNAAS